MPLLADYALTPDVFDITSYTSEEVCGLHLEAIREVLMTEGLVRDLRAGEWRGLFATDARPWHRRGKELVKKLATQGRLVEFEPQLAGTPTDDKEWCAEALRTHGAVPLTGGVIATEPVKGAFPAEDRVARIDRLASTAWWSGRSPSVRLERSLSRYQEHLDPILRCANSLQFIDPHLDPAKGQYRELGDLLAFTGKRRPAPLIEIHRVCYEGSGPSRRFPMRDDSQYFEQRFRSVLEAPLRAAGLQAEVFLWDDFHDRYLISNLIGIKLSNGFDTTRNPKDITTWARLGRVDRDDIQREFEESSGRHALRGRFRIP